MGKTKLDLAVFFKSFINLTDRVLPALGSASEMIVFLHLFSHTIAVGETECRQSYSMLASLTKLNTRTVQKSIRALIAAGLITVVEPGSAKRPAIYRVHFPHEMTRITRIQRDPEFILQEAGEKDYVVTGLLSVLEPFDRERLKAQIEALTAEQEAEFRRRAQEMLLPGENIEDKFQELVLLKKFGPDRIRKYQKILALKNNAAITVSNNQKSVHTDFS